MKFHFTPQVVVFRKVQPQCFILSLTGFPETQEIYFLWNFPMGFVTWMLKTQASKFGPPKSQTSPILDKITD